MDETAFGFFGKRNHFLPLVSFEIFQLYPEWIVFRICEHVDVLISEPELSIGISKTAFIVVPISVEIFSVIPAVVVPPLDHLWFAKEKKKDIKKRDSLFVQYTLRLYLYAD